MCAYTINLHIEPQLSLPFLGDELLRVVCAVLDHERQPVDAELTVVVAGDECVRELNRAFRRLDSTTDVLSFPSGEGPAFVTPERFPPYLGDVVVSYPVAVAQAAEQGHLVMAELALLIVHGCLHLVGYDHATEEERERMWSRQEEILRSLI
jgi:probable rRNA maturation factor